MRLFKGFHARSQYERIGTEVQKWQRKKGVLQDESSFPRK